MTKKLTTTILIFFTSFSFLFADAQSKAIELMKMMEIRKNIESVKANMSQYVNQMIDAQGLAPEVAEKAKVATSARMKITFQEMMKMDWEGMFAEIYTEVFSEDEMQGLIDFYNTPTGKKFIEKQPALQAAIMQKLQVEMAKIMPAIQQAAMEAVQEAKEN